MAVVYVAWQCRIQSISQSPLEQKILGLKVVQIRQHIGIKAERYVYVSTVVGESRHRSANASDFQRIESIELRFSSFRASFAVDPRQRLDEILPFHEFDALERNQFFDFIPVSVSGHYFQSVAFIDAVPTNAKRIKKKLELVIKSPQIMGWNRKLLCDWDQRLVQCKHARTSLLSHSRILLSFNHSEKSLCNHNTIIWKFLISQGRNNNS